METVAGLTLFHCMLFLKDRLYFFYLLCEEVYFAFKECLRIFHILSRQENIPKLLYNLSHICHYL